MPDGTKRRIIRQTVVIEETEEKKFEKAIEEAKGAAIMACPVELVSVSWGVKDYTEDAKKKYADG